MALSVLIVDDDGAFRRLAARLLEELGLRVAGEAEGSEAGVAAALELHPEVALVDIELEDGDGFELSRRLAALPRRPLVVLTSSDPGAATQDRARDVGAVGFVAKAELPGGALAAMLARTDLPPVPE